MYYVLRKMPPFTPDDANQWEADFCKAIAKYMKEIIQLVKPTKGTYVSCDGVVCAAKRKQQRLRRFKGPWASAMEARVTGLGSPNVESWDQTALTPGSAFMAKLGRVLEEATAGSKVIVSTCAEPGEGEHKLLARMRRERPASCVIYGLDADLILLAMLLGADTGASVWLLREAQEFETRPGSVGWKSLDINALVAAMLPDSDHVRDYVACMTLLGNDFLPRSLTRTVRDNGIPDLIQTLKTHVWSCGRRIVGEDGHIMVDGLRAVLQAWASSEEEDMQGAAIEAIAASRRFHGIGKTPAETALKEWNTQPARWATAGKLRGSDWKQVYAEWHPGSVTNYLQGVAWTWDYYSGRSVDQAWFFEEHLPPLWCDLAAALQSSSGILTSPPILYPKPLPDWLHLLAVLPAESVERLASQQAKQIMTIHPWYWPTSWSIFDVGRTQLWECEPVIPIIPEKVLRANMAACK
jgi:5'-3' exoribonuclease 1